MIKGRDAINEALNKTSMELLKIEDGGSKIIRFLTSLDDVICVYEHTEQFGTNWKTMTCLDKNYNRKGECPICLAGKYPSFKAYIPIIDKSEENKVKILKASKEMLKQIMGLEEEYGDITARDFKVTRSGKNLQTKYQFFARDPKKEDLSGYEIPDVESRIEPISKEAIINLMNGAGFVDEQEVPEVAEDKGGVKHPF